MNINSINYGSSTIIILNYLGMRKRNKNPWTTDLQIANFFPHKFQKRNSKTSDVRTCLNRMLKAGFVQTKLIDEQLHYSITKEGSQVPFKVAERMRQNGTLSVDQL